MKFARSFYMVAPYLYKNHLFVSPDSYREMSKMAESKYTFDYPADPLSYSAQQLLYVDLKHESLDATKRIGNLFCFVIYNKQIVHRTLVQTKGTAQMEGDRQAFILASNEKYIHSCYTVPSHRGKGLYTAVLSRIIASNEDRASSGRVFIACRQKNYPSVKGIQRAGFNYLKSSIILGFLSGNLRIRRWYLKKSMVKK